MAVNSMDGYVNKKTVSWKFLFVYKHLNRCNTTFFKMILSDVSWEKYTSLVIRQKSKSQNGCFKKTKHARFPGKRTFLTISYVCVSGGKKCSFFGKINVLCFLETHVLKFALLPYYRRFNSFMNK